MTTRAATGGYLIGTAAELAGMHPQTLRVYERRGLVSPRRSAGNTRLYSDADIRLLRRIQELSDQGLNLTGIERILELERRLARAQRRIDDLSRELQDTVEQHRRTLIEMRVAKGELVRVARRSTALVPRHRPVAVRVRLRGGV
ncbi:MAG: MerR family transcriptional regulator [Miltoncostaeaceae bacterium]